MAMDRLRRVANVWNWLPAFRVVAEYESIQKAAVTLNVSASALSRTVRLLEDELGKTLFVRTPGGLELTSFGSDLLKGTRDAMRRVEDVIAAEDAPGGEERMFAAAASGPVLARVLDRALCSVIRDFAGVRYRSTSVDEETAATELLRGNLDLALVEGGAGIDLPEGLASEPIGDLEFAVLAPPTHPMSNDATQNMAGVAADVAAAKIVTLGLATVDGGNTRCIAAVGSMESAEQLATHGPFLALLPRALAPATFRVVAPSSSRVGVTAVFRRPLQGQSPPLLLAVLTALRAATLGT